LLESQAFGRCDTSQPPVVNRIDLSEVTAPGRGAADGRGARAASDADYTAARPVLMAVSAIRLIPATRRAIVTTFVVALDQITVSFKAEQQPGPRQQHSLSTMEPKLRA